MDTNVFVSVIVCTYNQEKWIRKTLDAIIAQQTEYPFEVIIGEDFGTDGTRAICAEYESRYPNVHLAAQERNLGITANWLNCISNASGKYLMVCAGDDYWHNPQKIQIQVDYMESHPDCVVCHTDTDNMNDRTGKIIRDVKQRRGDVPPQGRVQDRILSSGVWVDAVTMCIRKAAFDKYVPVDKYLELKFPREDWPTLAILSAYGDIDYIPVSTATYRVGQRSSVSNPIDYDKICEMVERDKVMTEYIYSMFPEQGIMGEGDLDYFEDHKNSLLLRAAYINNDFKFAKEISHRIKGHSRMKQMARTRLTFIAFRKLRSILKT